MKNKSFSLMHKNGTCNVTSDCWEFAPSFPVGTFIAWCKKYNVDPDCRWVNSIVRLVGTDKFIMIIMCSSFGKATIYTSSTLVQHLFHQWKHWASHKTKKDRKRVSSHHQALHCHQPETNAAAMLGHLRRAGFARNPSLIGDVTLGCRDRDIPTFPYAPWGYSKFERNGE